MRLTHYAITSAAVILTLVCLSLPMLEWYRIPTSPVIGCLTGAVALALGICKIGFFPVATHHLKHQSPLAGGVLLIAGVLFMLVSIQSTSQFLAYELTSRTKSDNQISEQLAEIDKTLSQLDVLIDSDIRNNYRSRADKNIIKKMKIKEEKNKISGLSIGDNDKDISVLFNKKMALIVSIILHVACILSVLCVTEWRVYKKIITRTISSVGGSEEISERVFLNDEQQALACRIKQGEYTERPKIKALIESKSINGGFNKVKPVFDFLIESGDLVRDKQGFMLITNSQ